MAGKDANKGACSHPCRWTYNLVEETRPGEYMPVYENERGTYIYNSKDLNMIEYIDELVKVGVSSLKIEGRMKTALYVATVTSTYRKAIDDFFEDPMVYHANKKGYMEDLKKCSHRHFSTGFYIDKPDEENQIYDSNTYVRDYVFVGRVIGDLKNGKTLIEQRNKFSIGDTLELMKADGRTVIFNVDEIETEEGKRVESAPHPKQHVFINLPVAGEMNEIIRKIEKK
jgi:putative protease